MPALVTISPLPDPPLRSDTSEAFALKADAMVAALINMVTEFNIAVAAIPAIAMAINYNTVSTTSLLIGTGSKTFTAETGKPLQIGQFVIAASTASPTNYMAGQVTSYNAETGQLIINVTSVGGSGTFANWTIAVTPPGNIASLATVAFSGSGANLTNNSVGFSQLVAASAPSVLIGRQSGSAGNFQQITLGANLTMSAGGVLSVSTGTATVGDSDYGDIVVSGTGTIWTVDAGAITYSKMQNVSATDKILGRSSAGAGVVEEITCTAAARALLDDTSVTLMRSTLGLGTIATMAKMTAAQYWAATADKVVTADTAWAAAVFQSLTQAATIAVDMGLGINFTTTMTGNRALGNPTNAKEGQSGVIEIKQDATGGRTLSYSSNWKFEGGTTPTLTTTANARDLLYYEVLPGGNIYANLVKNV